MLEYLKVSKVKNFILAESNKQHQLGKPLVKALNEFIDRTLAASVTQANHDKQSRLENLTLINKELENDNRPIISKTKPDLPFLHQSRLKERVDKLSQGKVTMSNQFVVKLNGLLLSIILATIRQAPQCRINKPILISAQPPKRQLVATVQVTSDQKQRLPAQTEAVVEPEASVDKQQRQTKIIKIGLHLSKADLTATCQFFTVRDIARIETTVRERIFKGLLDSGFALDDLEKQIQIEVEIDESKKR